MNFISSVVTLLWNLAVIIKTSHKLNAFARYSKFLARYIISLCNDWVLREVAAVQGTSSFYGGSKHLIFIVL